MLYIIYNPLSNNMQGAHIIKEFKHHLLYAMNDSTQMNNLIKSVNSNDHLLILGGDGTLHYFINNFPTLLKLTIHYYPNGSGNDFYHGMTSGLNYYYTINNQYHFINSFGLGFDALVCLKTNLASSKNRFSYLINAYQSIIQYKPLSLSINYNGLTQDYHAIWLCSLQNTPYFGGHLKIAKDASSLNPQVMFCLANKISKFKLIYLLIFIKLGLAHQLKKELIQISIEQLTINNKQPFLVQLDGDSYHINGPLTLTSTNCINMIKVSKKQFIHIKEMSLDDQQATFI
ncbi:MAG: diacylglycerol/lipid kinase family protein [Bacilli bacterium]